MCYQPSRSYCNNIESGIKACEKKNVSCKQFSEKTYKNKWTIFGPEESDSTLHDT
jgi:hypothetical protein